MRIVDDCPLCTTPYPSFVYFPLNCHLLTYCWPICIQHFFSNLRFCCSLLGCTKRLGIFKCKSMHLSSLLPFPMACFLESLLTSEVTLRYFVDCQWESSQPALCVPNHIFNLCTFLSIAIFWPTVDQFALSTFFSTFVFAVLFWAALKGWTS